MRKIVIKTLSVSTILVLCTTSVIFGESIIIGKLPISPWGIATEVVVRPLVKLYSKKQANKEGYDIGYKCGYNKYPKESVNYTGEYASDYISGYENGYDEGRDKLDEDCDIAKEKGYSIGLKGEILNNTYTNETIKAAYNDGYEEGLEEYNKKKIEEYKALGKEDGILNNEKIDLSNIDLKFKNAYETAYNNSQKELENKYVELGIEESLKGNEYKNNDMGNEKFNKWFKLGYDKGKSKIEEEKEKAYSLGYEGKELVVTEEMKSVVKSIQESYDEGLKERNKKIVIGGVAIASIGTVGIVICYKKKKSKKKEL